MITEFLISIIYNVVAIIVNLFAILPNVSVPSEILNSITSISPYYQAIDTIFPVATLIDILAIELLFIGSYFSYKIIRWAYTKIPGIN